MCAFTPEMCFFFQQLYGGINQGILRKNKGESKTTFLQTNQKAEFGENYSLLLPSVTPDDSGAYECAISAKLGGKNLHFKVNLTVSGMIFLYM